MKEKLIKALSTLTGIRESKLKQLESNALHDIINKPNIIEPTEKQLEKLNILGELIINLGITKDFKYKKQINFNNPSEAGKYFKHLIGNKKDKEVFLMAMFDKYNNLIKLKKVGEGTINSATIYPRDIVKEVLSTKCKSVMFCHNHPSGITTPSDQDINLTKNYINILEPLKINVKDHIIVGNNVFSFLEHNLLDHTEIPEMRVADDENIYNLENKYYKIHLDKYLEALSNLTGISKGKINQYIEKELDRENDPNIYNHIALKLIEEPEKSASKLGLSNSQRKKLEELKQFTDNIKDLKRQNNVAIDSPYGMYCYYSTYKKENEVKEDNLYIMLFNSKLNVIGFEKLSYMEGNDIVYNPKDILLKSLSYEANGVSLIFQSENRGLNLTNKIMDTLEDISQNTTNMLTQLSIRLIDCIYVYDDQYRSLARDGYLPYTNLGQPDYKKTKILENIKEDLVDKEPNANEYEEDEEWEFEL